MEWLEKSEIKLISTQVGVEVEVGVELGKTFQNNNKGPVSGGCTSSNIGKPNLKEALYVAY